MIRNITATTMHFSVILIFLGAAVEAFVFSIPVHKRIQRAVSSRVFFSSSSDDLGGPSDFDDLADLWSMEDDDDDDGDDDSKDPITFAQSSPDLKPPVAAKKVTPGPVVSKKAIDFDDMANLWSREEEDNDEVDNDGGWPGAMNEIQRLKEMARKQLEEPAIKPPPPPSVAASELKTPTTKSASEDNFEDLTILWDMNDDEGEDDDDDDDEVVWMEKSEEVKSPADSMFEANRKDPPTTKAIESAPSTAPPQRISELTNGSGDLASLWSQEDDEDDDEGWPDATDEVQRLKLLERQKRAEAAAAPPAKKIERPTRRRMVRRTPTFWELRLRLIREYHAEHGHIDIPYRYQVQLEEGVDNDNDGEASVIKLGYFLYWLRSLFDDEHLQATAPFDVVKQLTDLGMKWKFLGKGRRQQLFLRRLNEWRDATKSKEGTRMDPTLRTWMWRQRYQYARQCEGLPSTLTPERVEALVDARIIPFQRPLRMMQDRWDKEWQTQFEEWKAKTSDHESKSSDTLMLWEWDQWRMFDILRGDIPYKGDLPVLLTGSRVMQLQEVNFFESSRPVTSLQPPDVEAIGKIAADWDDVVAAIREYYFNHGNFDITRSCLDSVGNESLYEISSRLQREYQHWIQQGDSETETTSMSLDDERMKDLMELNFFQAATRDAGGDDPIQLEYSWWEQYYDFKKVRRDYLLGNHASSSMNAWIEEQREHANHLFLSQNEGEGTNLKESHYEALTNLGVIFKFPAQDTSPAGRSAVGNVVGRPPSVLKLNDDILPSEQQQSQTAEVVEDMAWKLRYDELCAFVGLKGHSFVPKSVKPRLALWTNNQRLQYQKYFVNKNGEPLSTIPLNEQRIDLLKKIGFDFGVTTVGGESWDTMIASLKRFQAMHGHCFVPVSLPSNPQLGDWVNQQRQAHRCGELSSSKSKELRAIGFELDGGSEAEYFQRAFDALWDERRDELEQFKEEHGHCRPVNSGASTALASWAAEQRQFYRLVQEHRVASHLTEERVEQLEEMGFEWE